MFIRLFVFFARQRAASWQLAILLRRGSIFDMDVSDVSSRTMWMWEYLEDYRIKNRRHSKGEGKGSKKGQASHDPTRLSRSRDRHHRLAFPRLQPTTPVTDDTP